MVNQQVLNQLTEASLQRAFLNTTDTFSGDFASNTKLNVLDTIAATDKQELYPWVCLDLFIWPNDSDTIAKWVIIKDLTSEEIPDLTDGSVWETYYKAGKLFAHDLVFLAQYPTSTKFKKALKTIQFHNVKLLPGEQLKFVLMLENANSSNGISCKGELQYRKSGE